MKQLKDIITEKLRLDNSIKHQYNCHPQTRDELRDIIEKRLKKDKDADLNDIDVSNITNMSNLFDGLDPHNIQIDKWDVSNVTSMNNTFIGCKNFNCDLSNWDVSNVQYMGGIFMGCKNFNSDLNNWDVSKVRNNDCIFLGCKSLKKIPDWYKE